MRIVHWAPFGPTRAGIYEAARDHARADVLRGHEIFFCDTGVNVDGARTQGEAEKIGGKTDSRGDWTLTTSPWTVAQHVDLWVCHDGVPAWVAERNRIPMVWMLHGRPQACFRPEQWGKGNAWTLVNELAGKDWPRIRAVVTYWREHVPFWETIAREKLRCVENPPIDQTRFQPEGPKATWANPGRWNVLVCDSWREDVDIFEIVIAVAKAHERIPDLKLHIWGWDKNQQRPWDSLIVDLRNRRNMIGELRVREGNIDHAYRAADLLISPHGIAVRTIAEALSCGTMVVAGPGNRHTPFQAAPAHTEAFANSIYRALTELGLKGRGLDGEIAKAAEVFSLDHFGKKIDPIYEAACS